MKRNLTISHIEPPYYGSSSSDKADSSKSEPLGKKSVMPLTEQTLALHNDAILSSHRYQIQKKTKVEEEKLLEKALLEKVNERCDDIQLDFEEKIKVQTCTRLLLRSGY